MSKAKGANDDQTYLQDIEFDNFKSIKQVKIDFNNDLNIIIGKNGSGKTNFLNYLYFVVDINWNQASYFDAKFSLKRNDHVYLVRAKKEFDRRNLNLIKDSYRNYDFEIFLDGAKVNVETNIPDFFKYDPMNYYLSSLNYYVKFLKHGIPHQQDVVDLPIILSITSFEEYCEISGFKEDTYFLKSLQGYLESFFSHNELNENSVFKLTDASIDHFNNINEALKSYTDINGIRLNPKLNIYLNGASNLHKIDLHNFYIEFYINGDWVPYGHLSDGSKRLFYIISEIVSYNKIDVLLKYLSPEDFGNLKSPKDIILLEEPELGIHPHQLHKLMLFIKEQSREKQIILTTHSPQVLDVLGPDELDRVIICSYDQQKGTQLNHLTNAQIKKAQKYIQNDGFLSEYWRFSDLEPAS